MLIIVSQTVTQKQCTESKTGLGAQVHTQWTMVARKVRPGRPCRGHVVACREPYRRLVAGRVVGLAARYVAMPPRVSLRTVSQLLPRVVACCYAVSQRSAVVSRPKVAPLSHDTNLCIATLLPAKRTARRVARAPGRIAGLLVVSWLAAPCRGAPLHAASQPSLALLCHDTICCIVTEQIENGQ